MAKSTRQHILVLWLINTVFWLQLGDPFVSQNPREFYASHSIGWILVSAYTFSEYGQISVSCTISSGSSFPPSHAWSYTPFVLVYCSCLLCD